MIDRRYLRAELESAMHNSYCGDGSDCWADCSGRPDEHELDAAVDAAIRVLNEVAESPNPNHNTESEST